MLSTSLPLVEAFAKAGAYLASEAAARFAVVGVTYLTDESGLVEFRLVDGRVVGQQVGA